jgi:hypothetical protein
MGYSNRFAIDARGLLLETLGKIGNLQDLIGSYRGSFAHSERSEHKTHIIPYIILFYYVDYYVQLCDSL